MENAEMSQQSQATPLDADHPDFLRISADEAAELGRRALEAVGYSGDDARITIDQLIDNSLSGYRFAGLPRVLAIATDVKTTQARQPVHIVRETPVSALVDGGNNIGYVAAYRGAEIAIRKAKASGMATVGVFNSYYSGRNAYFVEKIVREGLVAFHSSAASPRVLPPGAAKPMLGTNPICFGFPSDNGPVVVDMGTASFMWGEVMLHAHLGEPLPEGVGFDEQGRPSTDGKAVLKGGVAPFGGHKGYGLSFAIQALGILAGAHLAKGNVRDYAFHFWAVDPEIMLPGGEFPARMAEFVQQIKDTPKQPGVSEIRIPSERAYRERERRRKEGILVDRKVIESLKTIAAGGMIDYQ
jgi:LDH2 family malate/lactate/ureidoglycolate dehydrogenase